MLENKPLHFDGSIQIEYISQDDSRLAEAFQMTDEMREHIGCNPYSLDSNE